MRPDPRVLVPSNILKGEDVYSSFFVVVIVDIAVVDGVERVCLCIYYESIHNSS